MQAQQVKAVGQLGVRAAALVELLSTGKPGDLITDEKMAEVCGQSVTPGGKGYASLQSAIRYVRVNHGLEWKRIPKVNGIKCLDGGETITVGQSDLRAVRKKSRRAMQKLGTVKREALTDEEKKTHTTLLSQFGALALFADNGTTKKIEARVDEIAKPNPERVLEFFKK